MTERHKVIAGEVRHMFIIKRMQRHWKSENSKDHYYIGTLMMDGRVFCEDFHLANPFSENWGGYPVRKTRIESFVFNMERFNVFLFRKYPLTERSMVFFLDTFEPRQDILYQLFKIAKYGYKFNVRLSKMNYVMGAFKHYLKIRKFRLGISDEVYENLRNGRDPITYWRKFQPMFTNLYEHLMESGQCPWINSESDLRLSNLSRDDYKIFKILFILLFWCVINEVEVVEKRKRSQSTMKNYVRKTNQRKAKEYCPLVTEDGRFF